MNRWAFRILGIIVLLIFTLMFMQMYKSLVMMQRQTAPVTAT
jgi:Tfp pilus assembly protein PilX